jgi:hypothetical protein
MYVYCWYIHGSSAVSCHMQIAHPLHTLPASTARLTVDVVPGENWQLINLYYKFENPCACALPVNLHVLSNFCQPAKNKITCVVGLLRCRSAAY